MAAWTAGDRRFDCSMCDRKEKLKRINGCNAMPENTAGKHTWKYPSDAPVPRAEIDRCPLKVLTPDIHELFSALSLADGRVSVADQQAMPPPYIEALSLASYEQAEKMHHEPGSDDG